MQGCCEVVMLPGLCQQTGSRVLDKLYVIYCCVDTKIESTTIVKPRADKNVKGFLEVAVAKEGLGFGQNWKLSEIKF